MIIARLTVLFVFCPLSFWKTPRKWMRTGRELAAAWDCPFIEASAKDRINVNDVFASVVREMNMTSEKRQQKSYCCCTLL